MTITVCTVLKRYSAYDFNGPCVVSPMRLSLLYCGSTLIPSRVPWHTGTLAQSSYVDGAYVDMARYRDCSWSADRFLSRYRDCSWSADRFLSRELFHSFSWKRVSLEKEIATGCDLPISSYSISRITEWLYIVQEHVFDQLNTVRSTD